MYSATLLDPSTSARGTQRLEESVQQDVRSPALETASKKAGRQATQCFKSLDVALFTGDKL
jgi:hypothetical protein